MYATFIRDGLVPNMEIGAIADINADKREQAAKDYGVPTYEDYQTLLSSGDVEAVVTTVPHYLHPEMGIAALKAGIHAQLPTRRGAVGNHLRQQGRPDAPGQVDPTPPDAAASDPERNPHAQARGPHGDALSPR